jgi:hypothetical protein
MTGEGATLLSRADFETVDRFFMYGMSLLERKDAVH